MRLIRMRQECSAAAEKIYYPDCIEHLKENVPEELFDLARDTLMYYMPRNIIALETLEERRLAVECIPEGAGYTKWWVKIRMRELWKQRVR